MSLRSQVSRVKWIRQAVRLVVALGDNVRPIVQRHLIREYIQSEPYKRVFDCGCGRGMYTVIVLPTAEHVAILDYSAESIEIMKQRHMGTGRLEAHVGSATSVPLKDNDFDLVLHCEVLEHVDDDRAALRELFRVCKPGGRLILSVPVPPAPIDDPNHVREGYTPEQITARLNEAGFVLEKKQFCMFGLSRALIKFETDWAKKSRLPLPTIIYAPLYIERLISRNWGMEKVPYDIIVQARKPGKLA